MRTYSLMRKTAVTLTLLAAWAAPSASKAEAGDATVGVLAGYNSETESALAGVYFQYQPSSWLRLAPSVQSLASKDDVSALHIDGNAHAVLSAGGKCSYYPLAGISYQSWRFSGDDVSDEDDTYNKFGVNVGLGFEVRPTSSMKFFVEGKYTFIEHYSSASVYMGIGYTF